MIQITISSHLGFPSVSIHTKYYDMAMVPGIGGRILEFGADGINLLYQNQSLAGHRPKYVVDNVEEMRSQRMKGQQLLYGGEKTWLAPQADWGDCPYADLDHGEYELEIQRSEDTVKLLLTSPVCRETQLQIIRTITCYGDKPHMDIEQKLINHGPGPVKKGLWQVTMLNRDGIVEIPVGATVYADQPVMLLNGENASAIHDAKGWRVEINTNLLYKLGFMTDAGQTTARLPATNGKSYTLMKTYSVKPEQTYPHNTVVEVYNASDYPYYELEVHSPVYTLQPGESASYTIRWELQAGQEYAS